MTNTAINAVYAVQWTEYEAGWGNRPDGLTLHRNLETAKKYISDYWAKQPDGPAPDEYSAPSDPKLMEVSAEIAAIVSNAGSIWANHRGWTVDENLIRQNATKVG